MNEVRVPVLHVFLTPWSFRSRHRVEQRPSVLHGRQFNEFLLEICKKACLNLKVLTVHAIVIFSSAHVFWATILYKHLETVLVIPLVPLDFHLFLNRALNGSTMYPSNSRNQLVFAYHVYSNSDLLSFKTKWLPVSTTVFLQLLKSDFTLPAKQKLTSQIATSKQKQTMEVVHNSA